MRVNSLALRLFVSATTVTVVILVTTGIVLSSLYRDGVERSFDRRLGVYLRTLVADVAAPEEGEKVAQSLGEPLFELPLSGWYWQVTKLSAPKPEVRPARWRSISAMTAVIWSRSRATRLKSTTRLKGSIARSR